MTYNVLGGTLSLTQSITQQPAPRRPTVPDDKVNYCLRWRTVLIPKMVKSHYLCGVLSELFKFSKPVYEGFQEAPS